jgi:dihydrofolate synthase/folylpolyglutamate synthase
MFRSFQDALGYLNTFTDYERMVVRRPPPYRLDRMRRLVAALGHPEGSFRSLHIAGTKGKGTVAIMAEAILRRAGYRTGLYTSPHLVDLLERIQVGGHKIIRRDFLWVMNRMEPHLRRLRPTFFETLTAAAFLLFARERVDFAVVEVGLGGRLDATNVLHPAACAITTIDYDHMDRLGHTLEEIASEKAGIVKAGVPLVTSPQRPAAMGAIRSRAEPVRARFMGVRRRGFVLRFTVKGIRGRDYRCSLRALGEHHAANAATAVALVELCGARVRAADVRSALAGVRLPGRVEVVGRRPWTVVDVAHNPVAARALAAALHPLPRRRTILVFGAPADKDSRGMLRALLPVADLAIFTRARNPRAAAPDDLARAWRGPALVAERVADAVAVARRLAGPRDAVVVAGSFAVAGEALGVLSERS